jgi:hypothetical protein
MWLHGYNTMVRPSKVRGTYRTPDATTAELEARIREVFPGMAFTPDTRRDHSYRLDAQLNRRGLSLARKISIEYQWLGGAVLTSDDLKYFDETKRGAFRRNGQEFAFVKAQYALESLSILVRMPAEFAPNPDQIEVLYLTPDRSSAGFETSEELGHALRHHAKGMFSLEVAYPRAGYEYVVAWPVAQSAAPSAAATAFARIARQGNAATELLQAFASALNRSQLMKSVSLGLYVPRGVGTLDKIGELRVGGGGPNWEVPGARSLTNDNAVHRHAWWGQIQRVMAEGDYNPALTAGERALAIVPIRQYGRDEGEPWGLVRVGIHGNDNLRPEDILNLLGNPQELHNLADGVVAMLHTSAKSNG